MAAQRRVGRRVPGPVPFETVLEETEQHVRALMTEFDALPMFAHCQRIAKTAGRIGAGELKCTPPVNFDGQAITLAALLHHCVDPKYVRPGEDADTLVPKFLISVGYSKDAAEKVQLMCSHASCVDDICTPALASQLCAVIPELQVVQDAVRIDQVGLIGILKTFDTANFTFENAIEVPEVHARMLRIGGMMKTKTGRRIAKTRILRAERILEDYEDEALGRGRQISKVIVTTPRSNVIEIEDQGAPSEEEEVEAEAGNDGSTSPRALKRASFLAPMANNSRKRAIPPWTEEDEFEADLLSTHTPILDAAGPIMTEKETFLRRPTAIRENWTCTETQWANLTYKRQLTYTHIGLMMETTDGTDCEPRCNICSREDRTCRKYRSECVTTYKAEHGLTLPAKCANCFLAGHSCHFPSKRRRH